MGLGNEAAPEEKELSGAEVRLCLQLLVAERAKRLLVIAEQE